MKTYLLTHCKFLIRSHLTGMSYWALPIHLYIYIPFQNEIHVPVYTAIKYLYTLKVREIRYIKESHTGYTI